jgi:alpha-D-ribose 1-methylphosphonate 5-triphosphate synthase subunit PhnH
MALRLVVVFVSLTALLLPSAVARADNPVLEAFVGANDAYAIRLQDANGTKVTHLDAGTYTIKVHDLSEFHNFHLTGPGVDMASPVKSKQEATWTVTLTDGTYTYVCDAHSSLMRGTFTAGAVTAPPPATQLAGTVGPGRKISLRYADGSKLTILAGSNTVAITVNDRTRTDNFHLTGPGLNKKTGVKFRGRTTWKLTLQGGRYVYRSDARKKVRGAFSVSSTPYPRGPN